MERLEKIVKGELEKYLSIKTPFQDRIIESMSYTVFTEGKRLRPIMSILTYKLFDDNIENILAFASAIELIHTYSLIHDDLPSMDNDNFRRGKPTNHIVFGEAMAVLSGDGLLNLAFEIMNSYTLDNSKDLDDYRKNIKAIDVIAKNSGVHGMIGGQVIDLFGNYKNMTREKLLYMYETKTAGLFQAAILSGAIVGGASEDEIEILKEYSLNLGLSYQIRDDILDIEEDNDIDKLTYLSFYNIEKAEEEIKKIKEKSLGLLDKLEKRDTKLLRELTILISDRNK